MYKHRFLVLFLVVFFQTMSFAQDHLVYIDRFKNIAIREMERTGVPASIKLAQGLLESGAGTSYLARKANNHFGMKCGSRWNGRKVYREDDDFDENGRLIKSCFRAYKSAEESYIAHSEFLRDPRKEHRYGFLFRYDVTDYKRWARGLKSSGYATSGTYAEKLINIIERYELFRFDRLRFDDTLDPIDPDDADDLIAGLNVRRINDVRVVLADEGSTPQDIALASNVKTKCVLIYNEKIEEPNTILRDREHIFLQKKRRNYRGDRKWHYVQKDQTMYDISQMYGIRLKNLYKRNRMAEGSQPEANERIKIRGWKVSKRKRPRIRPFTKEEKRATKDPQGNTNSNSDNNTNEDTFIDETNPIEPEIPTADPNNPTNPPITNPPVVVPPQVDPTPTNPPPPVAAYHTVVKGDTLYSISRRYGISVGEIRSLNGMSNNDIFPGDRLRVR